MARGTADELLRRALSRGITVTPAREKVIQAIARLEGAFSAGQLLEAVERETPDVGRATVFRTLQVLAEANLVEKVRLDPGQEVYVAGHAAHHHHHLICRSCHGIQPLDDCEVGELARELARRHGFVTDGHTFEIYGVCRDCRD